MKVQFWEREDPDNPRNGVELTDAASVRDELARTREREPVFVELVADNGYTLLLGIGSRCCAQYSATDGSPPHLMAVGSDEEEDEMEFWVGNTLTPVSGRFALPPAMIESIAIEFVQTGRAKADVLWESI